MAYGFRRPEHLIALALLDRGGYRPDLPGRSLARRAHAGALPMIACAFPPETTLLRRFHTSPPPHPELGSRDGRRPSENRSVAEARSGP
jgi:hypothetical protein